MAENGVDFGDFGQNGEKFSREKLRTRSGTFRIGSVGCDYGRHAGDFVSSQDLYFFGTTSLARLSSFLAPFWVPFSEMRGSQKASYAPKFEIFRDSKDAA